MSDIVQIIVTNPEPTITAIVVTRPGLPPGGTTGQILTKSGDGDYVVEWIDPPSGGGGNTVNAGDENIQAGDENVNAGAS